MRVGDRRVFFVFSFVLLFVYLELDFSYLFGVLSVLIEFCVWFPRNSAKFFDGFFATI